VLLLFIGGAAMLVPAMLVPDILQGALKKEKTKQRACTAPACRYLPSLKMVWGVFRGFLGVFWCSPCREIAKTQGAP
jgi:hypothetical protein